MLKVSGESNSYNQNHMNQLELYLFNVGHGLCSVLIERPENYVVAVDLGSSEDFHPLLHLQKMKLRPDILYITHPHADHLEGIHAIHPSVCPPDYIHYQEYDWEDVKQRERASHRTTIDTFTRYTESILQGDYNGSAKLTAWRYTPEQAKDLFGETDYVNNSSLFIVYKWNNFKIAIAGDQHTNAMESLCKDEKFIKSAMGTDIFIVPHHGHKQGYTSLWPKVMGKPYLTLASVQDRDPHVCSEYQSSDFAKGWTIDGVPRYCLTTRKDQHIKVNMWYNNGTPTWSFESLNLPSRYEFA